MAENTALPLVFVSIIVMMLFWVQNRIYREWTYWALEQKWTFILLVSLVFFNNPIFFLNIYAEHWIFPPMPCLSMVLCFILQLQV